MTTSNCTHVDKLVRETVADVLEHLSPTLARTGLSVQSPHVELMVSEQGHYTSELRVYFMRGNDIVDAIEFHIFDDGKQMIHVSQIREWIEQDVEDVIRRNQQRGI